MDATATLLDNLTRRGVLLRMDGDRLHVSGTLTDIDRAAIRRHKAALLAALHRPSRPVVLPAEVHGVDLDAIRALAGEDWGEIAAAPEVLETFTRSALLHGDLTRPPAPTEPGGWGQGLRGNPPPKASRTALEPTPRLTGHIPLGLAPGQVLDASRTFYNHLAGCRACCAPAGRYCAEGEALRQTYYTAAGEGAP